MISISELHKKLRAALVLAMMALSMAVLPACSSTEEAPPPGDTGNCEAQCGGDGGCVEECIRNLPI